MINWFTIYAIGWVVSLLVISYRMSVALKKYKAYSFELGVFVTLLVTFAYPLVLLLSIVAGLIRLFGYREPKPEDEATDEEN